MFKLSFKNPIDTLMTNGVTALKKKALEWASVKAFNENARVVLEDKETMRFAIIIEDGQEATETQANLVKNLNSDAPSVDIIKTIMLDGIEATSRLQHDAGKKSRRWSIVLTNTINADAEPILIEDLKFKEAWPMFTQGTISARTA